MTISQGIHRARSYLQAPGVNRAKVAEAAGLNWHAVNNLLTGDPRLSTLLAIEGVIPPDFVAPEAAPIPADFRHPNPRPRRVGAEQRGAA